MKRNIIVILAGIVLLSWIYIVVQFFVPFPFVSDSVEVMVPKGTTFRQAVEIFSKVNLMKDKNLFIFIGRISGVDRKIKAGYYAVQGSVSPFEIFEMLRKGKIMEYGITITEGDSLREIREKLSEKGIMKKEDFMRLSADKKFLSSNDIDAPTFEGYLFPATYSIPKGMDPEEAIGMMIERMKKEYSRELRERTSELRLSEREVLTLASIIEREAKTDEERPLISAVYHNRLKKGIRLQADPTAIYGIKGFKEKITTKDLRRKTPYNTYVIKGLPPGPICSPGIKSIIASVNPAKVPYIYFVSQNDGTHRFSVTEKEHLTAVKSYREKKQVENKKQ